MNSNWDRLRIAITPRKQESKQRGVSSYVGLALGGLEEGVDVEDGWQGREEKKPRRRERERMVERKRGSDNGRRSGKKRHVH